MNKRIIALCLCCLLLFSVISMPARADESTSDGFYFDISDIMGYQSFVIPSSGSSESIGYPLAFFLNSALIGFDFEICVIASGAEPILVSVEDISLDIGFDFEISNTVNGFFARGTFDGVALEDLLLTFTADGPCNFSVVSFRIYLQRYLFSNFAATVFSGYSTLPLSPGGSVTVASAPIDSGITTPVNYSIKVSKTYWADMDYMEFSFTLKCLSIDTISAYSTADNYLPIDINYVEQGYNQDGTLYDDNWFYVSGSVDLRSMDNVNTTGDVQILISCVGGSPQSVLTVTGLRGLHFSKVFNTKYLYLNLLMWHLAELNYGIINSVDVAIQSVVTSIENGVQNLGALISEGFSSLTLYFQDSFWPQLRDFWIELTGTWLQELRYEFDDLISVLSPDPVDQEVTDQMQQAGSELGGMTDQIQESVTPPNVDDINVGYEDLVEPSGMSIANKIMSLFTTSTIIVSQLTIVFSMGLAGYVLFGKR